MFSKRQKEAGIQAGARCGLTLHELGLILVMIGSLVDIAGVLCMSSSLKATILHVTQESAWLASPASQAPVK